jgi:hypothetical protein
MADPTVSADSGVGDQTNSTASKHHTDNQAILRCMRAWNYAYKKVADDLDEDENRWPAQKAGNQAYIRAMPPLNGQENICDFISCINFASMTDIVSHKDAAHYMANVRVALAALSLSQKPQAIGAKSGGKPLPSSAESSGE